MIYNAMNHRLQKDDVLKYLGEKRFEHVVDIGGAMNPWAKQYVRYYVDLLNPLEHPDHDDNPYRIGLVWLGYDMNKPADCDRLRNFAGEMPNGKFDFVTCTQTLEHLYNPVKFLELLSEIAMEGFISVPCKHTELTFGVACGEDMWEELGVTRAWRGFVPHRWIFTIRDSMLWCWPKLGVMDCMKLDWVKQGHSTELSFWWENRIPCKDIDDTFLDFPSPREACKLINMELEAGL